MMPSAENGQKGIAWEQTMTYMSSKANRTGYYSTKGTLVLLEDRVKWWLGRGESIIEGKVGTLVYLCFVGSQQRLQTAQQCVWAPPFLTLPIYDCAWHRHPSSWVKPKSKVFILLPSCSPFFLSTANWLLFSTVFNTDLITCWSEWSLTPHLLR